MEKVDIRGRDNMDIKNVQGIIKKTADSVGKTAADVSRKSKENLSKTAVSVDERLLKRDHR